MKVGDRVTISSSGRAFQIAAISGESKRQWKIGDYWRFDKDHLRLQVPGTGIVYTIKPATQEDIDDFRKRQLLQKLHDIKWGRLDLETLEKVFAIVCRMTEKKEKDK